MSDNDQSWITEGAEVAILQSGTSYDRVWTTTIERLTKTQIVLANGVRFNRESMREVGNSNMWHHTRLCRIDDPRVIETNARNLSREALARVRNLAEDLRNKDDDQSLLLLDELERAVDVARRAVSASRRIANS